MRWAIERDKQNRASARENLLNEQKNCRYSLNLYELIKKNNYQGFSLSLIRRFANSLISCLRLLYRENIIHCDLKPVGNAKKRSRIMFYSR